MNILIVGNVTKDVYLNLDSRTEHFETDQNGIKWLDLAFDTSGHHYFGRSSNFGGAAVSMEVLSKLGLDPTFNDSSLHLTNDGFTCDTPVNDYRYILTINGEVSYFTPSQRHVTTFTPPTELCDYLYLDRSANLNASSIAKISAYLDISPHTKLVIYLQNTHNQHLLNLLARADLIFYETTSSLNPDNNRGNAEFLQALANSSTFDIPKLDSSKIVTISDAEISYQNIQETFSANRAHVSTHLSVYSTIAATVLGSFISGFSVEDSLKNARLNVENSPLNTSLTLPKLQELATNPTPPSKIDNLRLIAASLLVPGKGILAADESGGSIQKKFANLEIPDTYQNRRDYRNIFFTTENLSDYISGVILFDETTTQTADDGRNFVDYLTSLRIIPGIKVDQGLAKIHNSEETYTKGLDGLAERLSTYYSRGLRFAKWRAAFELTTDNSGSILTPSAHAIAKNCHILADYAHACQAAGLVPIIEPELIYDGDYTIEQSAEATAKILDTLFESLKENHIDLQSCILKVNMILAGKKSPLTSSPTEVGTATAATLKDHIPAELAGIVFLSGGQSPEQATNNLAEVIKNGPFPWPITFSFARALQDPALYAWNGDNQNADIARAAFKERLIKNHDALENNPR